jgi:hypothetical protein
MSPPTYCVFASNVVCTAVQYKRGGEGLRLVRAGRVDTRHAHRVQDALALLVRDLSGGIATAKEGLDHKTTLVSEGREDSLGWRLVVVERPLRICKLLPEFTFFDGQLILSLGHGGRGDLSIGGIQRDGRGAMD